jgi:photosystem II stability/assembly factor-like uncharacterized protein
VLRTAEGGATWIGERRFEGAPADLYLFDVAPRDASRLTAVGLAGQVIVSRDGGATWQPRATGLESSLYGVTWGSPRVAVGDRGEIVIGSEDEDAWHKARRPPLFDWLAGVSNGGRRLFAVGERGVVLASDDAGSTWQQLRGPRSAPLPAAAR